MIAYRETLPYIVLPSHSYTYDAYGRAVSGTGSTQNSYQFAGEQFDESLGEYYLRQRYYDSEIGRFTRRDQWEGYLTEPLTLNKYLYSNANPINLTDPSGLASVSALEIGGLITAWLALNAIAYIATNSYEPESLEPFGEGVQLEIPRHTGRVLERVLDFGSLDGFGGNAQLEHPTIPGFLGTINDLVSHIFASEIDSEGRDWRGDRKLSNGEIRKLQQANEDIHELKGGQHAAHRDLYKDQNGNIYVKPKGGQGIGEPTGLNINDFL